MAYVIYYVVLFSGSVWDGPSVCEGVISAARGGIGGQYLRQLWASTERCKGNIVIIDII